ncbi:unnamed protein product [Adineta ricciae]|uniref:Uncharacterized protein n=1 Tax=Adineta ricciae TaxID=249248 RepID=A0A814TKW7_ADIRI|nr:unnamed protein product [Adineta ricciae]
MILNKRKHIDGNTKSIHEFLRFVYILDIIPKTFQYLIRTLRYAHEFECSTTKLENNTMRRPFEFLAAVCYHHYHDEEESKAFAILEKRVITFEDDEQDLISFLLTTLLKKVCAIKGTVNALIGIKHEKLFEILPNLLPHNVNVFFPTDTPNALAKLGDRRVIPLLTDTIDISVQEKDE